MGACTGDQRYGKVPLALSAVPTSDSSAYLKVHVQYSMYPGYTWQSMQHTSMPGGVSSALAMASNSNGMPFTYIVSSSFRTAERVPFV